MLRRFSSVVPRVYNHLKARPFFIFQQRSYDTFADRHIGPGEPSQEKMLTSLGLSNFDELINSVTPADILYKGNLNLTQKGVPEWQILRMVSEFSNKNKVWRSYIGQGFNDCFVPPVITRVVLENSGWVTQYTPYQAELSQGRLEQLFNWQTMVCEMTGMEVSNASLLDEASAGAEAMLMACRQTKRNKVLVDENINPVTLRVFETCASPLDIKIEIVDATMLDRSLKDVACIVVQYPDTNGNIEDMTGLAQQVHQSGALLVCGTDILIGAIAKPPGEQGADIVFGSSQRFGVPLFCGGPHAAFFATKQAYVKQMPGRLIGISKGVEGEPAFRLTLQAREQFIRKDKATSNICTAQALLANMSAFYAIYHGSKGIRSIAQKIHQNARILALGITKANHDFDRTKVFFDTITFRARQPSVEAIREAAEKAEINFHYPENREDCVSIALNETVTDESLNEVLQLVGCNLTCDVLAEELEQCDIPDITTCDILKRTTGFLTHENFKRYRSEQSITRYIKYLERKDYSLVNGMIPLGSCTMKLNGITELSSVSLPNFANVHPYAPASQTLGTYGLVNELEHQLMAITGYDAFSFQPRSGAQGEYVGLRAIKGYLTAIGESHRNICLIPDSSHGTNFASSAMAGLTTVPIKTNSSGAVDLVHLNGLISKYAERLACLMITYPSTCGVFDSDIRFICDQVHQAGGQVYVDGANLNAQVGIARPADYGSDVSHLNLHKTFCIPHGGGGPGSGPVGVRKHLIPYLPPDPRDATRTGAVSNSVIGSAAILPISWCYISLMGGAALRRATEVAILNANYMMNKLRPHYRIAFSNEAGFCAHEFIIDCKPFRSVGLTPTDIGKRLQDYSLHAPTVAWPYQHGLMIEPTESEDHRTLDRYCEALIQIRQEISDIETGKTDPVDNPIKNAPHALSKITASTWNHPYTRETAAYPIHFVNPSTKFWPSCSRIDDAYGDRNLVLRWPKP